MKEIKLHRVFYTDGACSGNPGAGGWAYVELEECESGYITRVTSGNKENTTNNVMELTAVYMALVKAYKEKAQRVTIYSDSAYVVNAIRKEWLKNWKNNGWKTKEGKDVKNRNIWEKMYKLIYEKSIKLEIIKVSAHTGNPLNELADKKAVEERVKISGNKE